MMGLDPIISFRLDKVDMVAKVDRLHKETMATNVFVDLVNTWTMLIWDMVNKLNNINKVGSNIPCWPI